MSDAFDAALDALRAVLAEIDDDALDAHERRFVDDLRDAVARYDEATR